MIDRAPGKATHLDRPELLAKAAGVSLRSVQRISEARPHRIAYPSSCRTTRSSPRNSKMTLAFTSILPAPLGNRKLLTPSSTQKRPSDHKYHNLKRNAVTPAPKMKEMGNSSIQCGERPIMHNGVSVVAGGYYGEWMTGIIERLRGHHEPQEEVIFHEILKYLLPSATMLELGGFPTIRFGSSRSMAARERLMTSNPIPTTSPPACQCDAEQSGDHIRAGRRWRRTNCGQDLRESAGDTEFLKFRSAVFFESIRFRRSISCIVIPKARKLPSSGRTRLCCAATPSVLESSRRIAITSAEIL